MMTTTTYTDEQLNTFRKVVEEFNQAYHLMSKNAFHLTDLPGGETHPIYQDTINARLHAVRVAAWCRTEIERQGGAIT